MNRKLFAMLFAAGAALGAWGDSDVVDGIKWTYSVVNGTAVLGGENYPSITQSTTIDNLVIPAYLGGYPVVSIESSSFWNCHGVKSITIPNGVTSIGENAFYGSSITNIQISSSVTNIGKGAFYYSEITDILIPDSVTYIADDAFYGSKLSCATIGKGVKSINRATFENCYCLETVKLPEDLLRVGDRAFYNCTNLARVTIGNAVTNIGEKSFYCCSRLPSIYIPSSVSNISDFAFYGCTGLINLKLPNSISVINKGAFSNCRGLTNITIPNGVTSIEDRAFMWCTSLRQVYIPDSVLRIGADSFDDCGLVDLVIPEGVTYIGDSAFSGCTSLTRVIIPHSVSYLGDSVFIACEALKDVTIGRGITNIRGWTFAQCDNISRVFIPDSLDVAKISVRFPSSPTFIPYKPIQNIGLYSNGGSVEPQVISAIYLDSYGTLPTPVREGYWFDGWTHDGEWVSSNTVVTALDDHSLVANWSPIVYGISFNANGGTMTNAYLNVRYGESYGQLPVPVRKGYRFGGWLDADGNIVTESSIPTCDQTLVAKWDRYEYNRAGFAIYDGWLLDYSDRNATALVVPEGVVGIGPEALAGMWDLQTVTLPKSLKHIAEGAFRDDGCLDNLVIPDSVETIGDGTFEDCSWLQTLTFGKGVKSVGARAFAGCTKLQKASFEEGLETIGDSAFSNCWRMASVSLPLSTSNVVWTAFTQCRSLVGVRMPTHMAPLSYWFAPVAEQIRDATIPAGETGIGYGAFEGFSSLRSVVFESSVGANATNGVLWIGDRAFYGCNALEGIKLPESLQFIGSEAFRDCTALKAMAIPQSVSWLGDSAFRGCSALSSLTLSKSLASLPDYVLYGCDALDSFTVPESVTYLGRQFASGSNRWCGPSAIYYLGNAPSYDAEAYAGTRGELTSYVVLGTRGWDGRASSRDIPAEWPVDNANAREIKTWSPNPFDVTFDANGGVFLNDGSTAYACEQISYTAYALPPYNPKRDQSIFDGWWTEPVGGAKVTSSTLVTLTKAHTLYAQWIVGGMVRVRFNATGGTVVPETGTYTTGVPFGKLPVPTREYWDFDGWWTEATYGTKITAASEVPAADVELFAHWIPARYTIVYHSENGYYGSTRTQTFTYGETVTLYRNYWSCGSATFGGWATEPGGPAVYADEKTLTEISDVRDGEIHLYAVWIGDSYSVRFDSNGGVGRMDNQTMMMGVTYALNTNCYTRSGYTYKGWSLTSSGSVKYKDGARVSGLSSVKNDTVVLYAVWEALKTYTVTFKPNGGTCSETNRYVVGGTKIGKLPVPKRPGYSFRCWTSNSSGGSVITPETVIYSSHTYYAQWDKDVISTEKHVTFDAAGGTSPETSRTVTAGNSVGPLPIPERDKHKFLGWYTAKDGGTKISKETKVTADVTYYAHWEEEPCYTCLIHFDANGGLCNVTNRTVFGGGTVGALPSAARWGWRFIGWFTDAYGGDEISADTVVEDNSYFYAHWAELDCGTYELGKLYGTTDSGVEQVKLMEMLEYAQTTHLPIVFVVGGETCVYCRLVHKAFRDSGEWNIPCLIYYDYYNDGLYTHNGVWPLLKPCAESFVGAIPALFIYWDLGDGKTVYKAISLVDSANTWINRGKGTIDKEAIENLIAETLSDPYAIAVDETETFIQNLPSVREIVLNIEDDAAENDGSVCIRLSGYANSDEMPTISVSGLPSGVKFDANTMIISGKVAKPGSYSFTVKATMETTNVTETRMFTLTVPNFTTDLFTAAGLKTDEDYDLWLGVPPAIGDVFTTITHAGWKLSVSGLPTGITFDAKNNSLKGVATKYGSYTVTFTATKGTEKQVATATFDVSFPEVWVDVEAWYDWHSDEYDDWDECADGVVSGDGFYQPGKRVTLKATPAKGSVFVGWYLDGWWGDEEDILLSKETTYSRVMPENDLWMVAVFATTVQDARSLKVEVADATTAADGAFSLDLGACVTSLTQPKLTVSGLPSGVKYDAKTMMISGKATKPGVYTITVSATNATVKKPVTTEFEIVVPNLSSEKLPGLEQDTDAYGVVMCGVALDPGLVNCTPEEGWTVKVAGLPAGLKFTAKDIMKKGSKTEVDIPANTIYGVPTAKPGAYTVTFTATKGKENQTATITLNVEPLPTWAVGTFTGYVVGDDWSRGFATMTVAENGKVSGKIALEGINWTFSATSFSRVEHVERVEGGVATNFVVEAVAKAGKVERTIELVAAACDGGFVEAALLNAVAEGTFGDGEVKMWRGMWKDKETAAGAKATIEKFMGVYTVSVAAGADYGSGYMSLTVGKDGNVKASGKLADGTSVSATSPLMCDEDAGWFVMLYAAPSAYKGGAFAAAVGFEDRLAPVLFIPQWTSSNPQATGEYGEGVVRDVDFVGAYYDKLDTLRKYYELMRLELDGAPELGFTYKETSLNEYGKKVTTSSVVTAQAADTLGQPGLTVTVNEKGAIVVAKATKPVQDKSTKEWSYDGVNDGALTLSFAQATGIFKGSYTFWYDYMSAYDETTGKGTLAHASKKVSFDGILVHGEEPKMDGFYLWDATGEYVDEKTGKPKTYKYKKSFPVRLITE